MLTASLRAFSIDQLDAFHKVIIL